MKKNTIKAAAKGIRATVTGIIANLILAVIKGLAGFFGNSYALIADAIESLGDVFSSALVWFGLRMASKPADINHPHGHGKAEPLAALAVGTILFIAAAAIVYQSILRIMNPHPLPAAWTLLVLVLVVVTKEILYRFVKNVGEEVGSLAVQGDAWHHRSDAMTSLAAFLGISIALTGNHFNPQFYWAAADDWAALFAAVIISINAWKITYSAVWELSDARPDTEIEDQIRAIAMTVKGVEDLDKCTVRKMGLEFYAELDVCVNPKMPVFEAHEIAHAVQDEIKRRAANGKIVRVLVHIEPAIK